jgi:hypothetical protein
MTPGPHLAGWIRPAVGWLALPADRRLAKRWPYENLGVVASIAAGTVG